MSRAHKINTLEDRLRKVESNIQSIRGVTSLLLSIAANPDTALQYDRDRKRRSGDIANQNSNKTIQPQPVPKFRKTNKRDIGLYLELARTLQDTLSQACEDIVLQRLSEFLQTNKTDADPTDNDSYQKNNKGRTSPKNDQTQDHLSIENAQETLELNEGNTAACLTASDEYPHTSGDK